MTATTRPRAADSGRLPVYGGDGQAIAAIGQARSAWMGRLLAECPRAHVYVFGDDPPGCPRCRLMGHK